MFNFLKKILHKVNRHFPKPLLLVVLFSPESTQPSKPHFTAPPRGCGRPGSVVRWYQLSSRSAITIQNCKASSNEGVHCHPRGIRLKERGRNQNHFV